MRLTHVSVPRDHLLRKTGSVLRDGTYLPPDKYDIIAGPGDTRQVRQPRRVWIDGGHPRHAGTDRCVSARPRRYHSNPVPIVLK